MKITLKNVVLFLFVVSCFSFFALGIYFLNSPNSDLLERNEFIFWLLTGVFLFSYILGVGLSATENLRKSILNFFLGVVGFSLTVGFFCAVSVYQAGGGEAGMLYFFVLPFVALATFLAGLFWLINVIKKNKKIFSPILSVFIMILLSTGIISLSFYAFILIENQQYKMRSDVITLDHCQEDSDCVYFSYQGFKGPINKNNIGNTFLKVEKYCARYSKDKRHCLWQDLNDKKPVPINSSVNMYCRARFCDVLLPNENPLASSTALTTEITLSGGRGDLVDSGSIEIECQNVLKNFIKSISFEQTGFSQCSLIESRVGWVETQNPEECPNGFSPEGCYICKLKCQ